LKYLIEADSSTIDEINNAKESSLHLAAQHGHGKVVATLLQKQANARLRNARFETALDIAARTGKENVCQLLICHCPELALQSAAECSRADNKTISHHVVYPLHIAARHGHISCLRVLCQSGFDVNYVTEEGTALHVAALFGQVEAVKLLLKFNIDVYVKDSQGKTVLEKLEEHENQKATASVVSVLFSLISERSLRRSIVIIPIFGLRAVFSVLAHDSAHCVPGITLPPGESLFAARRTR
jgi:ankyrin repeat protein